MNIPSLNKKGKPNKSNNKKANQHKLRVLEETKKILNHISICKLYIPKQTITDKKGNTKELPNSLVFRDKHAIKVDTGLAWSLDNIKVKWEVLCGVMCRDQQGNHYANYTIFRASEPCLSFDLGEITQEFCKALFEQAPNLHKLFPFWLAVPRSNDGLFDYNLILKTIHYYGALNLVGTNFEFNVNKPTVDYHTDKEWYNLNIDWVYIETEEESYEA